MVDGKGEAKKKSGGNLEEKFPKNLCKVGRRVILRSHFLFNLLICQKKARKKRNMKHS